MTQADTLQTHLSDPLHKTNYHNYVSRYKSYFNGDRVDGLNRQDNLSF